MAVLIENNATGRLAGDIDASQTTLSLEAGQGARFPSPSGDDWFPLTLVKTDGTLEIVHCTGRSNDTLSVIRGQEGTSGTSFSVGSKVGLRVTKAAYEDLRIPKGGIIKWSGAVDSIPAGWALCDGTNGTVDLTDKFVVGAGNSYSVGDTGGANSVTLTEAQIPAHNHTTNSAGGHSHSASTGSAGSHNHGGYTGYFQPSTSSAGGHSHTGSTNTTGSHSHRVKSENDGTEGLSGSGFNGAWGDYTSAAGAHSHSLNINSNGAHTHTVTNHRHSIGSDGAHTHSVTVNSGGAHTHTVNNTGGGGSHENRPPYYALAFIMKL